MNPLNTAIPKALIGIASHWRLRELVYLATTREALIDRVAVVAFCWAFKHLRNRNVGRALATEVQAGPEPVLYEAAPVFCSRQPNGFDEVIIYAKVPEPEVVIYAGVPQPVEVKNMANVVTFLERSIPEELSNTPAWLSWK